MCALPWKAVRDCLKGGGYRFATHGESDDSEGQTNIRARRLNGNICWTFTRKALLEWRSSTCSAKRRPEDPRKLRDNDSNGLDGREQLHALLWHHKTQ